MLKDDGLGMRKLVQRFHAFFPAVAALLHAAKRQFDAPARAVAVHEDLAATHLLRHPHLPRAIACPDAGHQSKLRRVGEPHRIRFILEGNDRQHRTEHFIASQRTIAGHRAE